MKTVVDGFFLYLSSLLFHHSHALALTQVVSKDICITHGCGARFPQLTARSHEDEDMVAHSDKISVKESQTSAVGQVRIC